MEKEIILALESLNLSNKEQEVYVCLLELGEASVREITKKSSLNRVTIYPVLKSLIEKGFVSEFKQDNKTYFKPIEPKQVLDILKEKETLIKTAIPLLNLKKNTQKEFTSVEIFKGSKGISSLFETLYSEENTQLYAYGNIDVAIEGIKYQSLNARNLRKLKKIKLSSIVSQIKEQDKEYIYNPDYKKVTSIWENSSLQGINVYVIFSEKLIGILELTSEITGILIENSEIAKYHKFVFNLLKKDARKII